MPVPDECTEDEIMNAPLHYFAGSCLVCKSTPSLTPATNVDEPHVRLSRCASCLVVRYCGKQHQRLDWRRHKPLCRWIRANIDAVLPPACPASNTLPAETARSDSLNNSNGRSASGVMDRAEWLKSRAALLMSLRLHVRRELHQHETEALVFAPVCEVCGRFSRASSAGGQLECDGCRSAFYCSVEHQHADTDRHAIWCAPLRLALQCDRQESLYGVADPAVSAHVDRQYCPLAGCISELVERQFNDQDSGGGGGRGGRCVDAADRRLLSAFISERLTFPLTLLYALQQISSAGDASSALYRRPVQSRRSLLVHVVGARALVECVGIIKWEYLAHRLPALQRLHLVMIGPELFEGCGCGDGEEDTPQDGVDDSGVTRCADCQRQNRQIIHEMRSCCYHDFCNNVQQKQLAAGGRRPDLIVCFNSGLHEFAGDSSGRDTWASSLPHLVQAASTGTPLVLTAYTHSELLQDVARLPSLQRLVAPVRNPFGSCRPVRDAVRDGGRDVFYMNQYVCVLGAPASL